MPSRYWPLAVLALALVAETSLAQSTSQGMFGSRTVGSGISGRGSTGGMQGGGMQGTVAGSTMQGDATIGSVSGSERFLRDNRQAGQFVGADTTESQNFVGGAGSGMGGFFEGLSGLLQLNSANANMQGNQSTSQQTVRVVRQAAFEAPSPGSDDIGTQLSARLSATPGIRSLGPLQVEVRQRTAIVRGMVATDHDRVIAELLIGLEPGISQIQNELTVAPPVEPPAAP